MIVCCTLDLYQINMMQVLFQANIHNKHAVFLKFFPVRILNNGYAVFGGGLKELFSYLNNLTFSQSDDYLQPQHQ